MRFCAYASDVTRRYAVAIEGPWGSRKDEISKLRSCAWFEGAAKEDGACLDVRIKGRGVSYMKNWEQCSCASRGSAVASWPN